MPEIGGITIPTWVCIAFPTAYLFYRYLTRNYDTFKRRGIPGPKPVPILGTSWGAMTKGLFVMDIENREKYGNVVGTFMGTMPNVQIYDLDLAREVMIKQFQYFQNHMKIGSGYITRKMLVTLEFDHWKHVRTGLTPTFSGAKMRRLNESVNRCCRTFVSHMNKKVGTVIEMKAECSYLTMDAIASAAFGIDIDSNKNPNNDFCKHGKAIVDDFSSFFNPKLLLFFFVPRLMDSMKISLMDSAAVKFFSSVVDQAIKLRKEDDSDPKDFLQMVIDMSKGDPTVKDMASNPDLVQDPHSGFVYSRSGITHEELLANALVYFLAGYDTTSTGLSFFCYNMACNPDAQEKVYQEIIEVMGDKTEPDYDVIKKMPYLQMCMEESLRLYPPIVRVDRVVSESVVINGVQFEKGDLAWVMTWGIHRNPEIWPEPEKYIPERFTPEEKAKRHPMAWQPFGGGPRVCIGQRLAVMIMKFAMVHLLLNFRLEVCEETEIPVKLKTIVVEAVNGLKIKMQKR